MANVQFEGILMMILNHICPFIADQGELSSFICLKGPVDIQSINPFGCKMSENGEKLNSQKVSFQLNEDENLDLSDTRVDVGVSV